MFDLDGVIVHSNPIHELAWRKYLQKLNMTPPDGFEHKMFGRRNDEIVRDLFGPGVNGDSLEAHGAAKEALYRELMAPVLHEYLVPGIAPFLERHQAAPMGLASNAERKNIDFVLDTSGLRRYFSAILDGGEVSRPKPDPEIYLRIAGKLGVPPRNCIVFEDSHAGVAAARAAGARVVGLLTTHAGFEGVALSVSNFLQPELLSWLCAQVPYG